jgi:ribosomal RNA-processing protein 17
MATSMLQPGIFNNPRPKRNLLPNPNKKRKTEHNVEEISFDDNARADYLTGFHKRKVERAKRAKAEAEKKMREERVGMRKQVRSTFFLSILRFFVNAVLARWVLILVGNS